MSSIPAQDMREARESLARIPAHIVKRFKRRIEGDVRLERLRPEVREIVARSSRPKAYLDFLERKDLLVPVFRSMAGVLANGSTVRLANVPPEAMAAGKEVVSLTGKGEGSKARLLELLKGAARLSGQTELQAVLTAESLARGLPLRNIGGAKEMLMECGIYLLTRNDGEEMALTFRGKFENSGVSVFVLSDPSQFLERNWGGHAHGTEIAVISEDPQIIRHELQHAFDSAARIFRKPAGRTRRESEEEYENRLASEIGFGYRMMEYRAKLSEIAFGMDPEKAYCTLAESSLLLYGVANLFGGMAACSLGYVRADTIIYMELMGRFDEFDEQTPETGPGWLRRFALDRLNAAYARECGLTYDELLEPFRKQ
ncbi:MAG: hypothetical protein NTY83_01770 [Candidatus Micrarchaeota archaeon]|nr:hypothetical protein [Candidatus Micrarchaeota archaeon]